MERVVKIVFGIIAILMGILCYALFALAVYEGVVKKEWKDSWLLIFIIIGSMLIYAGFYLFRNKKAAATTEANIDEQTAYKNPMVNPMVMSRANLGWIIAIIGAGLIVIAFLDSDRFWWWFLPGVAPFLAFLTGLSSRCPKCGRWWAENHEGSDLLDRWQESKDIPREDITRNSKGEVITRKKRIESVIVNVEKRSHHYNCKYCSAEWSVISEHRDR